MKRLSAILISLTLVFSLFIEAAAFEIKNQIIPAPVITDFSQKESDRGMKYTLSFTDNIKEAEQLRELVYGIAVEKHGSPEKLLASNEAYLSAKTKNYCQISTDKTNWYTLFSAENTFSFTLYDDVLTLLKNSGVKLSELTGGFTLYLRMLTASENFSDENVKTVYVYTYSEEKQITCPSFSFIDVSLPVDAFFSEPFTIGGFSPEAVAEDIVLPSPSRQGYIFDGWSFDGEKRINTIPAGTVYCELISHWIPRVYEINYYLTTYESDKSHSFGAADNSRNPVEYTVGTGCKLYDIISPVAGFVFDGWYLSKDFSGERITEISSVETGDRIFYAKWLSPEDILQQKENERQEFIKNGKFGDVDDNGSITAADARLILRYTVGLEKLDTALIKRADYKNSGTVSASNARTTLRISVGLDSLYNILLENGILP